MNPDASSLTRLARLRRELAKDLQAIDARAKEAESILASWPTGQELPRAELVLLAVNLHGYYTGLETLLERTAMLFDEEVPHGASWHIELLDQMLVDVPGLRPALIPESAANDLHELRKFRHFFRNAYVLSLDAERVREHAERLGRLHGALRASLSGFQEHINKVIDAFQAP